MNHAEQLEILNGTTIEFTFHLGKMRPMAVFTKDINGKTYHWRELFDEDEPPYFNELMESVAQEFKRIEENAE